MALEGAATRLTIFVGDDDRWQHKSLAREIVDRAHGMGLAGASVLRGVEGFGVNSLIHTTRLVSMAEGLPMVIVIIDTEEKIRTFLPELDEVIGEGLVVIDPVEVVGYVGQSL